MSLVLTEPKSLCEYDAHHLNEQENIAKNDKNADDDGDLIFGALDDDHNPSIDEEIHLRSNDKRKHSSTNTVDSELDSVLPIVEGDRSIASVNQRQSLTKEQIAEQFIKMANFSAKHRRSKVGLSSHWKDAARKAGNRVDPWVDLKINQYPEEIAIRHEYDPIKCIWNRNEIIIKIESRAFEKGSMRECFRLKKLETFSSNQDWDCASNYIAKRYIDDVPNSRYFDDVMMQMTTKLWAARYNQHKPPKKIDIIQMSVLEFKNRADQPLYHLEGFIEGTYIKYNSNSGFVCDDTLRHTPQAFSHFTFEASCHQQIVVDIQGVGDLYTDPQIHTNLGIEYGEGNLGIRGMALFFYTHECNPICTSLNLTPFDLSSMERERQLQQHLSSPTYVSNLSASTACRGSEEPLSDFSKFGLFFRQISCQSIEDESDGYISETSSLSLSNSQVFNRSISVPQPEQGSKTSNDENIPLSASMTKGRIRLSSVPEGLSTPSPNIYSRSSSEFSFKVEELFKTQIPDNFENNHRPSSVFLEKALMISFDKKYESILGQIHLEICKCYQIGRFSELGAEEYDETSALYHLEQAAELDNKNAIFALAKVYLDLPRDLLANYSPTDKTDLFAKGFKLLLSASEFQENEVDLILAQFYDTGVEGSLEPDWQKAVEYYEKYIHIQETEINNEDDQNDSIDNTDSFSNQHGIVARLATLYKIGEHNLECNYRKAGDLFNKAAEMATAAMKGRIATKYYQAAEEAYALEPDEEI